jgi:hypothetical protein
MSAFSFSHYSPHYQPPARAERPARLNDDERSQWIDNDEGLYNWFRSSRQSKRAFIRANRAEIDAAILAVRDGTKPAHFLAYGG